MAEFNLFIDNNKFTYEYNKKTILFLDLKLISSDGKLITSVYSKHTDCQQYNFTTRFVILNILKGL